MDSDGIEFYRRFQRFDFFEADAEFPCIVSSHFALAIDLGCIDGLIIPEADQAVSPWRRDDAPRAVIPIESVHDAFLAVIIEEAVCIIVDGHLADVRGLDVDAAGIIVCIRTVDAVEALADFHLHVDDIRRGRVGDVHDLCISWQVTDRCIGLVRGAFRIVARQCHIPASALPVDRIERHKGQISIWHPFEEGDPLPLEIHFLRISKIFGFVNGDSLRSHICHIFIVMRVVGFPFHADFRIEFLAFLFRQLCDFILHVGHVVVT